MKQKGEQQRRSECAEAMLDLSVEHLRMTPEEPGTGPRVPQSEVASGNGTLNDQGYVDAGCQTELTMDDIEKMEDVLRQNTTELADLRTKAPETQFNRESFKKQRQAKVLHRATQFLSFASDF
ncbi:hypothetical protein XENOCAPTIV_018717 [Xenoophorus captivus]|uniref:Uncharacterized protein n=1 Tax=Xenoophorus captivus TaxID=1517983 RepID=A0ABV0R199_9TELE